MQCSLLVHCADTCTTNSFDKPDNLRPNMISKEARVITMQLVKTDSLVRICVFELVECVLAELLEHCIN